jgi:Ca2+ transporting ATPase
MISDMEKGIHKMAEESLRTLVLAYKHLGIEDIETTDNLGVFDVEKRNLIFLAIIGVKDIPRPEVPHAIESCKRAGIRVRMVTGDNIVTARAIAKEVGIIDPSNEESLVMEGIDFVEKIGGVVCEKCRTAVCGCERDAKKAKAKD